MKSYLEILSNVRNHGSRKTDRTGTGTLSLFGLQSRYDLSTSFPAVTTKKLAFRAMTHELLWFLRGETNIAYLKEKGVGIWDPWADAEGEVGPLYGVQWRSWPMHDGSTHDQIAKVIKQLRNDPDSRRHIVSAWNVSQIEEMALAPCHMIFQFYISSNRLSCMVFQRSADLFLGVPFNIASYSLLTCMTAQVLGIDRGELVHVIGDAHIYLNHLDVVDEQLKREAFPLPVLHLDPSIRDIDGFRSEHIRLENYRYHPALKAPIAV